MSNSSREYSPDWLRNVQAPPIFTLSSSSESIPATMCDDDDDDDDQFPINSVLNNSPPTKKLNNTNNRLQGSKVDKKVAKGKTPHKLTKPREPKSSVWTLPSNSECKLSEHETSRHLKEEDKDDDDDDDDDVLDTAVVSSLTKLRSPKKRLKLEDTETKGKSLTKQENDDDNLRDLERDSTEKQIGAYISSSRLPLVLADKVQRSKVLVECEGESIDLSGDLGSVGRVVISDSPFGNQDMLLDLKGTIYKTTIIPSRTFCIVSFGQSEAKIEAIMNDFIQLKPQSNVYEAETMVEGTLEGFSFDSEDEGGNKHTEENEGAAPQTNGNDKRKTSDASKKKGKTVVKKPAATAAAAAKKVNKRKAPVVKKNKSKK